MLKYGYQIGEASKITGISKDTLHFYIKSGLITPDYIDPQNHYSYFPVGICTNWTSLRPAVDLAFHWKR